MQLLQHKMKGIVKLFVRIEIFGKIGQEARCVQSAVKRQEILSQTGEGFTQIKLAQGRQ